METIFCDLCMILALIHVYRVNPKEHLSDCWGKTSGRTKNARKYIKDKMPNYFKEKYQIEQHLNLYLKVMECQEVIQIWQNCTRLTKILNMTWKLDLLYVLFIHFTSWSDKCLLEYYVIIKITKQSRNMALICVLESAEMKSWQITEKCDRIFIFRRCKARYRVQTYRAHSLNFPYLNSFE